MLNWLPKHDCGLHITHNGHRDVYETIEEYTDRWEDDWVNAEERQKAIDTDELWELQWYPDTPIGFYRLMASSLDAIRRELENDDGSV